MQLWKFGFRIWLTMASIGSFVAGWIFLSHSPKPVQPTNSQVVIPTLEPLPPMATFGDGQDFENNPFLQQPSFPGRLFGGPRFITGGS